MVQAAAGTRLETGPALTYSSFGMVGERTHYLREAVPLVGRNECWYQDLSGIRRVKLCSRPSSH